MNRRSIPLLVLAIALAGCRPAGSQTSHAASLGTAVTLAPAERAVFSQERLEVQFVAIVEDSRCPRDVACLWAGEVKVQLAIRGKSAESTHHELPEAQSTLVEGYRVTILEVRPEALSTRKISPEEYRVTLKVERG